MRKCLRCERLHTPARSTSSLPLTYCGFLCEKAHLGFSIEALEHMQRPLEKSVAESILRAIEDVQPVTSR